MINEQNETVTDSNVAEEFSIGNMAPVVPVTGDVLSKNGVAKPAKLDTQVEDGSENGDNDIEKSIAVEFDALDMMVPGTGVTEDNEDDSEEMKESADTKIYFSDDENNFTEASDEEIDDDMKPFIKILNDKGYKTKYSCSGHPSSRVKNDKYRDGILNGKLYSTARIIFDGEYDLEPPTGWEQKHLHNSENFAIYVKAPTFKIVDGLPKEAFYKWKKKYMNALKTWADDLPVYGESDPNDHKNEDEKTIEESVLDDILIDAL